MSDSAHIETLLRQFYEYQGALRGFVFSATRDYHATEDILQDVAIVVAQKASTFDRDRPTLPWFMGIARNHIQRWHRKKGRENTSVSYELLQEFVAEFSVYGTEQLSNRRIALRQCMRKLPDKQRNILQLRYMEDMDCSQISATVGRSVQGIYALLKRMKNELKKCVIRRMLELQIQ